MKLHERIKHVREDRKLSQDFIANELGLSQSQYSRRENGETKFIAEELIQLSKALDTKIADLYGEDRAILDNNIQIGGAFDQYITVSDKLIEQFELRIQEKDEIIKSLTFRLSSH